VSRAQAVPTSVSDQGSNLADPANLAKQSPEDWAAWIDLRVPEADLLKPLPAGALAVETVRPASE